MLARWYTGALRNALKKPYVHLMFGARQTGKSTLIESLLPRDALRIDLSVPGLRSSYFRDPDRLIAECRALGRQAGGSYVFIDEAQSVPATFDAVQHLYDSDRERWRFVLCGSSARKLRHSGANLLPGRSFLHRLYPLTLVERMASPGTAKPLPGSTVLSPLPFSWREEPAPPGRFPAADLVSRLAFGELPGISLAPEDDRAELLRGYAVLHLEEEIRREATVKDWAAFLRFLRLAALESGGSLNYQALAREAGVSQPTVKAYYQLLGDMFTGFVVSAWSRSPRKHVLSTPRFLFFDLGVRHAAAGLAPSPETVLANPGPIFEQWVGIELWKRLMYLGRGQLHYLRTKDGSEVDYIVELDQQVSPVEVKWTDRPTPADARHLRTFLDEHPQLARHGFMVCRAERPMALGDRITAIPWSCL